MVEREYRERKRKKEKERERKREGEREREKPDALIFLQKVKFREINFSYETKLV